MAIQNNDKRVQTEAKKNKILDAGRILLSEEGYSEVSLRKVAAKVGIHLKTLQHYFPTKENLIQSILEYTDSLYSKTYEELRIHSKDPEEHFKKFIQYLIEDNKDKHSAGFFSQLWARAHNDDHAKETLFKMYNNHTNNIAELMKPLNPEMPKQIRKERAYMIASIIDGSMLHLGYDKKRPTNIPNFEQEIITLALNLATTYESSH